MMRASAYNRFGVLMGTSSRASGPRWLSLRGDSLPMITLISSQGDFCATAPMIFGTSNVSGAGWIVPAKYYQQVGPDGFKQKPIGAGPYKLVNQEPGTKLEFEAFEDYYRPVHVKRLVMIAVPEGTTR